MTAIHTSSELAEIACDVAVFVHKKTKNINESMMVLAVANNATQALAVKNSIDKDKKAVK